MKLALRPRRWSSLLLALAVVAAGCSPGAVLARKPVAKQRFVLQPPPPVPRSEPQASGEVHRAGVLRVAVVREASSFQNRGFVFRTGPDRFTSDFYNEFAAPPGTLLRDVFALWLRDGTHFASVVRGSESPSDWVLETDLESLYADVRDPAAPPQTQIAFAVRLLDAQVARLPIRFEKRYATSEVAADRSPRALAEAWSRGLGRLLAELAADLDAATARRK
jgi:ABC-type uncharacterized transport system auxiliary subunit